MISIRSVFRPKLHPVVHRAFQQNGVRSMTVLSKSSGEEYKKQVRLSVYLGRFSFYRAGWMKEVVAEMTKTRCTSRCNFRSIEAVLNFNLREDNGNDGQNMDRWVEPIDLSCWRSSMNFQSKKLMSFSLEFHVELNIPLHSRITRNGCRKRVVPCHRTWRSTRCPFQPLRLLPPVSPVLCFPLGPLGLVRLIWWAVPAHPCLWWNRSARRDSW